MALLGERGDDLRDGAGGHCDRAACGLRCGFVALGADAAGAGPGVLGDQVGQGLGLDVGAEDPAGPRGEESERLTGGGDGGCGVEAGLGVEASGEEQGGRMEGAGVDAGDARSLKARCDLTGGLAGVGDNKDRGCGHGTCGDSCPDPGDDGAGLSGAGCGDDGDRALPARGGLVLFGVKAAQVLVHGGHRIQM